MIEESFQLSPLEIAMGTAIGAASSPPAPPRDESGSRPSARSAIEDVVTRALERPPCVVSFSGGRDSSAMLVIATHVARSRGLPLPVPVTLRFPKVSSADETSWQEEVVERLRLDDWIRIEFDHELDVVGPVAAQVFARHGLVWPFNAHFHLPVLEQGAGGSLLTGVGGDEIFTPNRWARVSYIIRGRLRPRRRDLKSLAILALPRRVRAAYFAGFESVASTFPWLTPEGSREAESFFARLRADEPLTWSDWIRDVYWPSRHRLYGVWTLSRLASDHDVWPAHPFADADVLESLLREWGPIGPRSRAAAMRTLFGDLLPEAILSRASKASFDGVFWNRHARDFVARWDGGGVPTRLVDTERLREIWSEALPAAQTYTLLQSAFMFAQGLPRAEFP